MMFKEELAQKIIEKLKWHTRRPIKDGETLVMRDGLKTVLTAGGRIKIQVGRDYAVPYGRGKVCRWWHPERCELITYAEYTGHVNAMGSGANAEMVFEKSGAIKLRHLVTDIWQEDVRNISFDDSVAEGFDDEMGFWDVWTDFYDPTAYKFINESQLHRPPNYVKEYFWVYDYLMTRPAHLYQGFAYKIAPKR